MRYPCISSSLEHRSSPAVEAGAVGPSPPPFPALSGFGFDFPLLGQVIQVPKSRPCDDPEIRGAFFISAILGPSEILL